MAIREEAEMAEIVRIGIIGDRDPGKPSHAAPDAALEHAAGAMNTAVEVEWLPTGCLEGRAVEIVESFDALWCAPGSPYESFDGALEAIRVAREDSMPFIGTCGGFQHAVIEYARTVLDLADAAHAEYDLDASAPFISALACPLVSERAGVRILPGTRARGIYGVPEVEE